MSDDHENVTKTLTVDENKSEARTLIANEECMCVQGYKCLRCVALDEIDRLWDANATLADSHFLADAAMMVLNESGAPNYFETILRTSTGREFTLTFQRKEGKSPHELRKEAEAEVERLRARLHDLYGTEGA
jgi:hypothetical protein